MMKFFLKHLYHFIFLFHSKPINGLSLKDIYHTFKLLNLPDFSFNCTQCGKCCYGPGNVYFTEKDLKNIKKYLKLDQSKWQIIFKKIIKKKSNGLYIHHSYDKCYFLNQKNQCIIYPVRPLQCRTFPFWPSNFSTSKELNDLVHQCPGSNLIYDFEIAKRNKKKPLSIFSLEEIVFRCNSTIKKFNRFQIDKKFLIKL